MDWHDLIPHHSSLWERFGESKDDKFNFMKLVMKEVSVSVGVLVVSVRVLCVCVSVNTCVYVFVCVCVCACLLAKSSQCMLF